MSHVMGKFVQKKIPGSREKFPGIIQARENELELLGRWEGGLDGVMWWSEWRNLVITFERALLQLPNVCLKTLVLFSLERFHRTLSHCRCHIYGYFTFPFSRIACVLHSSRTRMLVGHLIALCVPSPHLCTHAYGPDINSGLMTKVVTLHL